MRVNNGSILGQRDMEFTDEEITCKSDQSNTTSTWKLVKSLEKGSKSFYLYVDVNAAYIIPKRIFTTKAELEDFERFVETKIGV